LPTLGRSSGWRQVSRGSDRQKQSAVPDVAEVLEEVAFFKAKLAYLKST
jgi:hypothetical protein